LVIFLFIAAILAGCGAETREAQLVRMVSQFQLEASSRGWNVAACPTPTFTNQDAQHSWCNEPHRISIPDSTPQESLEFVVFHALGHCWLGLPDSPVGLMSENGDGYLTDRRGFLDSLFQDAQINGCVTRVEK
jgi:hypothetical protein